MYEEVLLGSEWESNFCAFSPAAGFFVMDSIYYDTPDQGVQNVTVGILNDESRTSDFGLTRPTDILSPSSPSLWNEFVGSITNATTTSKRVPISDLHATVGVLPGISDGNNNGRLPSYDGGPDTRNKCTRLFVNIQCGISVGSP